MLKIKIPKIISVQGLILCIALISLWATVTNAIPLSAALAAFVPIAVLIIVKIKKIDRLVASLLFFLSWCVFSLLVYAPQSVLFSEFYRRDGNIFITYAPILVLSLLSLKISTDSLVRKFIFFSGIVNLLFTIIYLITGGTLIFFESGVYHLLFATHNAAGGFIAVIASLSIGYAWSSKGKERWLLIGIALGNILGLYLTDSRGSLLALFAAIAIVLIVQRRILGLRLIVSSLIILQIGLNIYLYSTTPATFTENETNFLDFLPEDQLTDRDWTIYLRTYYVWPRAIHFFLQSPFIGTGFGSFNDIPAHLRGIPHILILNRPEELIFNDGHAHHTFLHILAETGIVGFLLVLIYLYRVEKFISSLENHHLRLGMQIAYWSIIFMSLSEYGFFIPSIMLPFNIILGLAIAQRRYVKRMARIESRKNALVLLDPQPHMHG